MDDRSPDELLRDMSWLRRLARRLVADAATADDLTAEAMAAWSATNSPVRSVRGWLATVLRHHAERHRRRDERRRRAEFEAAAPRSERAADESLATAELHKNLADAVLALDAPYRTAIVLRFLDELPLHEVARRLDVPVETARTRIRRGLDKLRARLDERHGGRAAWAALVVIPRPESSIPVLGAMMATKSVLGAATAAVLMVWLFLGADEVGIPPPALTHDVTAAAPRVAAPDRGDATMPGTREARTRVAVTDAGRSGLTVLGRIVDEATRTPVAGADVTGVAASDRTDAPVTTDRNGAFVLPFAAAADDDATIVVAHRDYALVALQLRGASRDDVARTVDCGDIEIAPGTLVTGVVIDANGRPVPTAALFTCDTLWTSGGRRTRLAGATHVATSGADGTFRLDRRLVPNRPPTVLIAASAAGAGFVELGDLSRTASDLRVEVRLSPSVLVTVSVVGEDDAPIRGALVTAEPNFAPVAAMESPLRFAGPSRLADTFSARTDENGRAVLRVPVATAAFAAGNPVVNTAYRVRGEATDRDGAVTAFDFVDAPPAGLTLRIELPRRALLELSGRVCDPRGQSIPDASVTVHGGRDVVARTDEAGKYTVAVERGDGRFVAVASAPGRFPQTKRWEFAPREPSLAADFELEPALRLEGRVVDQDDRAVAGANVWVAGSTTAIATDTTGAFAALVSPDRPTTLEVAPPGHGASWNGPIEHVIAAGQRAVTLTLSRIPGDRSSLVARLVDPSGAPLDAQHARLRREDDGQALDHPVTNTIGRVTATNLAPGNWSLDVVATRGCGLSTRFVVRGDGQPVDLSLRQSPAIAVEGEIASESPARAPARLDLSFAAAGQAARFVAGPGQRTNADHTSLTIDPAAAPTFRVEDVDPARPLVVVADGDVSLGEGTLPPHAAAPRLRVVMRSAAHVRVISRSPFHGGFLLQLRRPGGEWEEPIRFVGGTGGTELLTLPIPAGAYEWRLRAPSRGLDNAGATGWQTGAFTVAPEGSADVEIR